MVAVRRLPASYWGSFQFHELKDELLLAANLKHDNIVQLLGICLEQRERLLVYEYLPYASLDTILFGNFFIYTRSGRICILIFRSQTETVLQILMSDNDGI